jgi:hypothetical protein
VAAVFGLLALAAAFGAQAASGHSKPEANPDRTTSTSSAYAHLSPSGPLTVIPGEKFSLDLMIDSGAGSVTVAQSYLTFTTSILQNVEEGAAGCVPTQTVAADLSTFDVELQNEVCNSDTPCDFGRIVAPPASIAFASGISYTGSPVSGDFRVASVAFCALAPGQAVIHWQFYPEAPATRDSLILDDDNNVVSDPGLYTDYIVNVVQPTHTPTATPTSTHTATPTYTPTPVPVLVGHVTWQGRPAQPNTLQALPITLTLKAGSTEVNYPAVTTDPSGFFTYTVGGLASGTYNWRVKGPKFLANSGTLTLTGGSTSSAEMGLMRTGDANNDNLVSIVDFGIVKNSTGTALGDPGYDDRADFNGDLRVNIVDFGLMRNNFGVPGAGPLHP